MPKLTFKVEGLSDSLAGLQELTKATEKNTIKRALMNSALPIETTAEALVPRRRGSLARSLTIGTKLSKRQKKLLEKASYVEIYVGAGPLPQAHMQEFGTHNQPPQPYLRPAVDSNIDRVISSFKTELKIAVDKAAQRAARKAARLAAKMKTA